MPTEDIIIRLKEKVEHVVLIDPARVPNFPPLEKSADAQNEHYKGPISEVRIKEYAGKGKDRNEALEDLWARISRDITPDHNIALVRETFPPEHIEDKIRMTSAWYARLRLGLGTAVFT